MHLCQLTSSQNFGLQKQIAFWSVCLWISDDIIRKNSYCDYYMANLYYRRLKKILYYNLMIWHMSFMASRPWKPEHRPAKIKFRFIYLSIFLNQEILTFFLSFDYNQCIYIIDYIPPLTIRNTRTLYWLAPNFISIPRNGIFWINLYIFFSFYAFAVFSKKVAIYSMKEM